MFLLCLESNRKLGVGTAELGIWEIKSARRAATLLAAAGARGRGRYPPPLALRHRVLAGELRRCGHTPVLSLRDSKGAPLRIWEIIPFDMGDSRNPLTIFDRTVARREREGGRRRLRGVACRVAQLERRERSQQRRREYCAPAAEQNATARAPTAAYPLADIVAGRAARERTGRIEIVVLLALS